MRGKIDTNLGWLRVVKTRPVSYEWSNRYQTALALVVEPLKTTLNVMVSVIKLRIYYLVLLFLADTVSLAVGILMD